MMRIAARHLPLPHATNGRRMPSSLCLYGKGQRLSSTPPFMDQGTSRGAKADSGEDDADSDTPSFLELRLDLLEPGVVGSHTFIQGFDLLDQFANLYGVDVQGAIRWSH